MSPMTRYRADDNHVQLPFVKQYYTQRSCVPGTLIITEATLISKRAGGYTNVPGIWEQNQIKAWKEIVQSVHNASGMIFLQLWALGRTDNPLIKESEGSGDLVSASDIPMSDDSPVPRPLDEDEIKAYIQDYATAARNAVEGAGFDGVEVHGANGYLIDQFIQDVSNKRTDAWGGSVENRARFAIEVCKAVVDAVGAERTAIRLSPFNYWQGMLMKDPYPQFSHLIRELKKLKLTYLHLVEGRIHGNADIESTDKLDPFIDIWAGTSPVIINGGFKPESARKAVEEHAGKDVAVAFGRYSISNPDLIFRIERGIPLKVYNRDTVYKAKSEEGYIDYPFSDEWEKEHSK